MPTPTPTHTGSRAAAVAVLAIERTAAGGHAIAELRRGTRIVVGAGATLIVEPVAATLALPGAAPTLLTLDVTVCAGGRLVLDEGPLIVAAGAHVERRCTIELEAGAIAAVRETVVLGRDGESPGTLDSVTRVSVAGTALLHDGLRIDATGDDAHVAVAPGHRVLASAGLFGMRPAVAVAGALDLEGPGALLRMTGASTAATEIAIAAAWVVWAQAALGAQAPRASVAVR